MTLKEQGTQELEQMDRVLAETGMADDASGLAQGGNAPGLLSRLMQIQIDAPEDFAANLDRYQSRL